jgi:hypothetical protein
MSNSIEWNIKEDSYKRAVYDSYDFWYDLTMGGYIQPEKVLQVNQAKKLQNAIDIVESFQKAFEDFCCEDEEE